MASESPPNPYETAHESGSDRQKPLHRTVRFWIPALICVLAIIAVPVAFFLGGIVAEVRQYNRRAEHQNQRIEAFFAEHPDKFANLTVEKASNGWAHPVGTVKTQADYDFLVNRFNEMFGDELTEHMIVEGG